MAELVDYLRNLDTPSLERLAGTTIVRAVRSVFNVNRESELARLVSDRYGNQALSNADLRNSIIDVLPRNTAEEWCKAVGIVLSDETIPQARLHQYFSKNYTLERSQQLVSLLGLAASYVRVTEQDDRLPTEIVVPPIGDKFKVRGFLHPYQKHVKDELLKAITQFVSRVMVQMPTGAGKTATALEAAIDICRLPFHKRFIVWLVDSNELAEQALATFRDLWVRKGDHPIAVHRLFGGFSPDLNALPGGVVFASFGTFWGPVADSTHSRHSLVWKLIKNTDLLIVDEAHTSVAETYEQVIRAFIDTANARLVGLSATPARLDGESTRALAHLYTGQLIRITDDNGSIISDVVGYLQSAKFLAKIHIEELESGANTDESKEGRICRVLAENSERNELILKQIERAQAIGEPSLIFSCTKDHVFALVALCRAQNIVAEFIVGETPMPERNRILGRFRDGSCGILINYDILSTGVDLPNLKRLILTRPIGSPIQFSQILGRALRGPKNGGNESNTIVTIRDNLTNFASANYVFQSFANEFIGAD